ncbi:Carnitine O-acetyltransferase mitochondrial [Steccherinum ochraceum]|uniref:Carnitine O-acetyltransferase, mitochondrial n=1 Tax=Steccherinum ochraceum TaxID=92696 RepID=A0A4R0RX32_9APHY|nr:Carnitine O-acetyltransferase mitochondrial [Steccherinum ochraceum]
MSPARTMRSSAPRRNDVPPGYTADPSQGPMLRYEASLPRLPVPALSSTAAKYLESVQPHLTAEEFATTRQVVEKFLQSDQSKQLQERLQQRAADPNNKSWLAEWWNDAAYMGYRDTVVVNVSYYYVHVDDKTGPSQAKRAATLLKAMLPFRALVESKQLEPEKVRGAPLAMSSYEYLFHSSRYPVKPSDTARKFDPSTHNHVVFVRKNKFFKVPLVNAEGRELSAAELEVQIEKVIKLAGKTSAVPVGALTSDNRDTWAQTRAELVAASPANAKSLEDIECAMIIVCLDDYSPVTREQTSWGCWVGDGKNRFYDKHQLIVYENGKSGFLGEHSCMDGTPTLRMTEFMMGSLAHNKANLGPERTPSTGSDLPAPTELPFALDVKTERNIKASEQEFEKLVGAHDMEVLHYEGYGKEYIKKFKASPDAWAQLTKQLAFHKMFGRPGVCYESAQTRKYQLGRTEVIRSASNESKAFAEAMLDPKQTDTHRATLFRRAVARHLQYAAWAADGQGVDRHLFGLKKMLKDGEPVPAIYSDPAFSRTNHWELSTSNLSSQYLDGWGYGEVVPDGYGLSYSIGDNYIRWTITSVKRRTAELKHYIAEAATEIKEMMERAAAAAASTEEGAKAKL